MNNYPGNVIVVTPAGMARLSAFFLYEEITNFLVSERLLDLTADSSRSEVQSAILSVEAKIAQVAPMFGEMLEDWEAGFAALIEKVKEIDLFGLEVSETEEFLLAARISMSGRVNAALNSLMPETDEDPKERLLRFHAAVFGVEPEDLVQ